MIEFEDRWFEAEGEADGKPMHIRGRMGLQEIIGLDSHPQLLRIIWVFEPADESGLPDQRAREEMMTFENLLFEGLEKDQICIFFSIYIHNGELEWSAYCSDADKSVERLNQISEGREYPVTIEAENDPEWSDYEGMLAMLGHDHDDPPKGSRITLEQLREMFQNMGQDTDWDLNGDLKWGYFFTHREPELLLKARADLEGKGYRFVDMFVQEKEVEEDPDLIWLHVEKVEKHTPESLQKRNLELYALADRLGLESYDGMDVGPVEGEQ